MNIKAGFVGLPNVGKSTIFNILTQSNAPVENYPFCTIDPNIAITEVPDSRLKFLKEIYGSKKIIPTIIEFVDIAGLVKGASTGAGLGNKFLANIREVALIIHVIKCFDGSKNNTANPLQDLETIITELALKDLETVKNRINKALSLAKKTKHESEKISLEEEIKTLQNLKSKIECLDLEDAFKISKSKNL
jgi:ribosome-binding ATPase